MSYPSGDFAVIVSEYDRASSKLDEKSVLEHARVVSQSFRTATVLPFRFGTIFDTEDAIRQAVRSNRRAPSAKASTASAVNPKCGSS